MPELPPPPSLHSIPATIAESDRKLVQIIDAALADSVRRSGDWLVCRQGCTQCCVGAFAISQLDARRLHEAMKELDATDPGRATRIRQRAADYVTRLSPAFPGDPLTGMLDDSPEAEERFEDFANDEPCPALDPVTGACDVYAARPMTCRAFGPPIRSEDGLGVCELCFHGATDEEIATCEMEVDPDNLELALLNRLASETHLSGRTIVAYTLTP